MWRDQAGERNTGSVRASGMNRACSKLGRQPSIQFENTRSNQCATLVDLIHRDILSRIDGNIQPILTGGSPCCTLRSRQSSVTWRLCGQSLEPHPTIVSKVEGRVHSDPGHRDSRAKPLRLAHLPDRMRVFRSLRAAHPCEYRSDRAAARRFSSGSAYINSPPPQPAWSSCRPICHWTTRSSNRRACSTPGATKGTVREGRPTPGLTLECS